MSYSLSVIMSNAFLSISALSSSSFSSYSKLSLSLMSLIKFTCSSSVKPSIVHKFDVEYYVLVRNEISSNGLINSNPETLTSNASYIPVVFEPFIMIDKPIWEVILLQDSINLLVWRGFKDVRWNCISISSTFFP